MIHNVYTSPVEVGSGTNEIRVIGYRSVITPPVVLDKAAVTSQLGRTDGIDVWSTRLRLPAQVCARGGSDEPNTSIYVGVEPGALQPEVDHDSRLLTIRAVGVLASMGVEAIALHKAPVL